MVRIIVLQFDKASKTLTKYINDIIDCDHDATLEVSLDPGDYYLAIEVDWKCNFTREMAINFYGQHPVQMTEDAEVKNVETLFH